VAWFSRVSSLRRRCFAKNARATFEDAGTIDGSLFFATFQVLANVHPERARELIEVRAVETCSVLRHAHAPVR
jgi:hypothetical protein